MHICCFLSVSHTRIVIIKQGRSMGFSSERNQNFVPLLWENWCHTFFGTLKAPSCVRFLINYWRHLEQKPHIPTWHANFLLYLCQKRQFWWVNICIVSQMLFLLLSLIYFRILFLVLYFIYRNFHYFFKFHYVSYMFKKI